MTPRASLRGQRDVDVAIVGGGFTGLWTARELKRRDPALRIAVLEKHVCGFGASGRNGGWASALYPVDDERLVTTLGIDAFTQLRLELQRAVRELGEAVLADGIDADFIQGGTLTFARNEEQAARLRQSVTDAHERGYREEDLEWLDEDDARARATPSDLLGATFSPHCARVNPARLVRGLAEVNEHLGVELYENTEVRRIVPRRGAAAPHVVTVAGTMRANYVVRATEGFTPTLPGERRSVAPLYSLMIASEPQSQEFWDEAGLRHYETFADDRHVIIYGQRTGDDRFAFGGRGAPYHFGSTIEPRYDEDPRVFALLESTLRELFPGLEGEVTHRWGGPLAMPRDHFPSVLVDHASGLASAGGYTGDGVVMSYVAGSALADLIDAPDVATNLTSLPFVHHTSKRWEVEPLRWLGINAGLALAARADRDEEANRPSRAARWLDRLLG